MIFLFPFVFLLLLAGIFFQKKPTHKLFAGLIFLTSLPISMLSIVWLGFGNEKFISTADGSVGQAYYIGLAIFVAINLGTQLLLLFFPKKNQ